MVSIANTLPREYRNGTGGPRSRKEILELIDQASDEARATYNRADPNRDLTEQELARINLLCDHVIPALCAELKVVEATEQQRLAALGYNNRTTQMVSFNNRTGAPDLQLPVNGRDPSEFNLRSHARRLPAQFYSYFDGGGDLRQAREDIENTGLFLRCVLSRGTDRAAAEQLQNRSGYNLYAAVEGTGLAGGYLVPQPLVAAIEIARAEVGVIRLLATQLPMTNDTLSVPSLDTELTVQYPGEAADLDESNMEFGQLQLTAKKRAVYCAISNELQADAIVPMTQLVAQSAGYALALAEDSEAILGDSSSSYGGVAGLLAKLGAAGTVSAGAGHDTWPELDAADHLAAIAKVHERYRVPTQMSWICSASYKATVMDRIAAAATGTSAIMIVNGIPQFYFLGYPVVVSDRMPTSTAVSTVGCLFGNFRRAILWGDRGDMRMAVSEHVKFRSDQTVIRVTHRYDLNVHAHGDASTAGAYVGLATTGS